VHFAHAIVLVTHIYGLGYFWKDLEPNPSHSNSMFKWKIHSLKVELYIYKVDLCIYSA